MRILYWYTRFLDKSGNSSRYHGLEEFELNLSIDTRFHYDYKNHCISQSKEGPTLPINFWGNGIYNVSVLTGDNGAGKSTIINCMINTLNTLYNSAKRDCDESAHLENETVFIIEYSEHRFIAHIPGCSKSPQIDCSNAEMKYCRMGKHEFDSLIDEIRHTKIIYLTNTFSETDDVRARFSSHSNHIRYHFLYDYSTCGVMRHNEFDDCRSEKTNDLLLTYFSNEIYKQVKFVCSDKREILNKLRNKHLPVPIPDTLSVTIQSPQFILKDDQSLSSFYSFLSKINSENKIAYRFCISCFDSFIGNLKESNCVYKGDLSWNEIVPYSLDFHEWKRAISIVIEGHEGRQRIIDLANRCLSFIWFICNSSEILDNILNFQNTSYSRLKGELTMLSIKLTDSNRAWLNDFIGHYRLTCTPHYFLEFNWGLSSGENNILRLFSSLYYVFGYEYYDQYHKGKDAICNVHPKGIEPIICDTVLLFLDEADLTYHPEWQRQFISLLTAFLPELFNRKCGISDIQILLTTHSPLLIGDCPKRCVTYLGDIADSGKIETFGQNIHQILRDSFFLHNGTIGAFAERKINQAAVKLSGIIKHLKNEEKMNQPKDLIQYFNNAQLDMDYCYNVIELVAPGVLKNKLLELYEEAELLLKKAGWHGKEIPAVEKMSRQRLEYLAKRYLEEHPEG